MSYKNDETRDKINKFIGMMEELIFINDHVSSMDVTNKISSAFINILGIVPEDRKSKLVKKSK